MKAAAIIAAVVWAVTFISNALLLAAVYQVLHGHLHWAAPVWVIVPGTMAILSTVLPFRLHNAGHKIPALVAAVASVVVSIPALAYCVRLWGT